MRAQGPLKRSLHPLLSFDPPFAFVRTAFPFVRTTFPLTLRMSAARGMSWRSRRRAVSDVSKAKYKVSATTSSLTIGKARKKPVPIKSTVMVPKMTGLGEGEVWRHREGGAPVKYSDALGVDEEMEAAYAAVSEMGAMGASLPAGYHSARASPQRPVHTSVAPVALAAGGEAVYHCAFWFEVHLFGEERERGHYGTFAPPLSAENPNDRKRPSGENHVVHCGTKGEFETNCTVTSGSVGEGGQIVANRAWLGCQGMG